MVLMALDHTRDFWGMTSYDLTDPAVSSPAWFATRWVTHFCAPVFVLLTGLGAYLYGLKGRSTRQQSFYLASRGLWLVFLDATVVTFAWRFSYGAYIYLSVLAVIGWSMILLAGLIWLPRAGVVVFALLTIVGHNLLDPIQGGWFGRFDWIWFFLHEASYKQVTDNLGIVFAYPLIPWCGVMALGYAAGPIMLSDPSTRKRCLVGLGLAMCCLFLILRIPNIYGDPHTWSVQPKGLPYSIMSFLRISKYPPSLQYLCVTLGPSLLLLTWMESWQGRISSFLRVFGRVPLFFYLIHVPIIRLTGSIKNHLLYGEIIDPFGSNEWPAEYEPKLWLVFLASIVLLILLYPVCRWYGDFKQQRPGGWVSWL